MCRAQSPPRADCALQEMDMVAMTQLVGDLKTVKITTIRLEAIMKLR